MTSTSARSAKLKDDILTQLAEQIKALQLGQQSADVVGDTEYKVTCKHIHLQCLLDLLDHILLHGLLNVEYGYWPYVVKFTHSETIRLISAHTQVTNDLDKGRVWVFMAISECVLESYIRMFIDGQKTAKKFYSKHSFLRDRERLALLLTLVSGLDFIVVALDQDTPYLGYGALGLDKPKAMNRIHSSQITGSNNVYIENRPCHSREGSISISSSVSNSSTITGPTSPASTCPSDTDSVDTTVEVFCERKDTLSNSKDISEDDNKRITKQNKVSNGDRDFAQEAHKTNSGTVDEKLSTSSQAAKDIYSNVTVSSSNSKAEVNGGQSSSRPPSTDQELLRFMDPMFSPVEEGGLHAFNRSISGEFRPRFGSNLSEISMDEVEIVFRHDQKKTRRPYRPGSSRKKEHRRHVVGTEGPAFDESLVTVGGSERIDLNRDGETEEQAKRAVYIRTSSVMSDFVGADSESLGSSVVSGDSLDQFCRDADFGSSFNLSTELADQSTLLECHNEQPSVVEAEKNEDEYTKREKAASVLNTESEDHEQGLKKMEKSSEYDGIILGLPTRPSLAESSGSLCDVSLDPNTILLVSLEIFKRNGEQFHKMFRTSTGHQFGQLQAAYVMLTNYAVYLLRKVAFREETSFHTDVMISFEILRKIEIGLNCQTVTIASKNQTFTVSFGDEASSRSFITSLTAQVSKASPSPSLSNLVSSIAVQQETVITKWMAQNDKLQMADSSTSCFSLVHWCGLSGPDSQIEVISFQSVIKGTLEYKQQQYLGMSSRWATGYFVLTNGTLWQYSNQKDKTARVVIDLRGSRCGGCRQIHDADRPYAFEIVSSDGTGSLLVLAVQSEHDACEWIFKICQSMAESFDNDEDRGCTVMRCVPCCLITTNDEVVVTLAQPNGKDSYQLVSNCSVQSITRIFVDYECRNYCIVKFEYSEKVDTEASWFVCFRTEYELGKFERAVAEAWRELFQVDLQFLVLGDGSTRQDARERAKKIEHFYAGEL